LKLEGEREGGVMDNERGDATEDLEMTETEGEREIYRVGQLGLKQGHYVWLPTSSKRQNRAVCVIFGKLTLKNTVLFWTHLLNVC